MEFRNRTRKGATEKQRRSAVKAPFSLKVFLKKMLYLTNKSGNLFFYFFNNMLIHDIYFFRALSQYYVSWYFGFSGWNDFLQDLAIIFKYFSIIFTSWTNPLTPILSHNPTHIHVINNIKKLRTIIVLWKYPLFF